MFGTTQLLAAILVAGSRLQPAIRYEEKARSSPAAQTPQAASSQISGYMDFPLTTTMDDPAPPVLDFHRCVLLFTHQFSDRVRFVGELELEHAIVEGLEEGGELELEQAYLDFLAKPSLNFRAGMLLVPIGIINERHEP